MAGVGGGEEAGGEIQDAEPDRDEHFLRVPLADFIVHLGEDLRRAAPLHGDMVDQGAGQHHEEGGRNALAGNVADDQAEVSFVNEEEIVQVAADLLGRGHGESDIDFFAVGNRLGKEVGLDAGGQGQLRGDALLFQGQGAPVPGGLDIMGGHGAQIKQQSAEGQPEDVHYIAQEPEDPGGQEAGEDQGKAQDSAEGGPAAEEQPGRGDAQDRDDGELNAVRHLGAEIARQEALDHVGLVFHAEHGVRLGGGGEIGVLQGRRVRADEDDLSGPGVGGDLPREEAVDGIAVVIIPGLAGEGHVIVAGDVVRGEAEILSPGLGVKPRGLGGHGIDHFSVRPGHIEQGVAENAIPVAHGVDMALDRDGAERLKGLDEVHHRGGVALHGVVVFPDNLRAVLRHAGGDHIAELFRGGGEPLIRPGAAFAFIQHVDGGDGGALLRIGGQLLQGIGNDGPVGGAVGAQLGQRLLIDADDHNLPGGDAALLIKGVLHPFVRGMQDAGGEQRQDSQGRQEGKEVFLKYRFHRFASRGDDSEGKRGRERQSSITSMKVTVPPVGEISTFGISVGLMLYVTV